MTINLAPLPENTGAPQPTLRATPDAVSAAGVRDPAAVNRQQLPSAVPAPVQVAAYAAYLPTSYKPLVRTPSSSTAAQFIDQGAAADESALAIFEPPPPPAPPAKPEADAYLADLRMARGEVEHPPEARVVARADASQAATVTQKTEAPVAERSGIASLAATLPPLSVILGHKPGLSQVLGVAAYQLATNRNASLRKAEQPAA